jgi:hypothetical protein
VARLGVLEAQRKEGVERSGVLLPQRDGRGAFAGSIDGGHDPFEVLAQGSPEALDLGVIALVPPYTYAHPSL